MKFSNLSVELCQESDFLHASLDTTKAPAIATFEGSSFFGELTNKQLPLSPELSPEFDNATRWKRRSDDLTATSLLWGATDRHVKLSLKLFDCSTLIHASEDGKIERLNRCRHRICPHCSHVESTQWHSRLNRAINAISFTPNKQVAMQVTLNAGETHGLSDIRVILQNLHKAWPSLLKTKRIADRLHGAFRATEIQINQPSETEPLRLHPHIHALLLLDIHEGEKTEDVISSIRGHIRKYWPKTIKRLITKAINREHNVVASTGTIDGTTEQTKAEIKGWLRYITKSAVADLAKTVDEKRELSADESGHLWVTLEESLKNVRLIAAYGSIKEELAAIDDDDEAERISRDEGDRLTKKPTHQWSQLAATYVALSSGQPSHPSSMIHGLISPLDKEGKHEALHTLFNARKRHRFKDSKPDIKPDTIIDDYRPF